MTALPRTSGPATRALEGAGYDSLESLAGANAKELLALHGFGPEGRPPHRRAPCRRRARTV